MTERKLPREVHLQFVRDRRTGLTHNVLEVCGSERGVRYVMAQDSEIAKDRDKYQLRAHLQAERITQLEVVAEQAQAVVDGTKANDYGVTLGIAIDALKAHLDKLKEGE